MITLIIKPGTKISQYSQMLTNEYGTASNIKSRVNRLSVLSAITSAQHQLKLYHQTPPNGLAVFCGICEGEDGKEHKVNESFEPPHPVASSLYKCDARFHTDLIGETLVDKDSYGYVIVDGHGCLYGTVSGNRRQTISRISVSLPKKHGRGGQSALRFSRLRDEAISNYVRKICEGITKCYITNDRSNVVGVFLAGTADMKALVGRSELFDPRVKILDIIDIAYGGDNGFNQAIGMTSNHIAGVHLMQEKRTLEQFYQEISKDSGLVSYGLDSTISCLEMGAVERLVIDENTQLQRFTYEDGSTGYGYTPNVNNRLIDKTNIIEWLIHNGHVTIELVSDQTAEGTQFIKGFGGIGAFLRWKVQSNVVEEDSDDLDDLSSYL